SLSRCAQPATRASSTNPNILRMRSAGMSRVQYQSPLRDRRSQGPRDIYFQGHDGFDTAAVPPDHMPAGPPRLDGRVQPDDPEPSLRLRAEQPVPLDARQIAEWCCVSE